MKIINLPQLLANYFYRVGIWAHFVAIFSILLLVIGGFYIFSKYDLPAKVFLQRTAASLAKESSPLLRKASEPINYLAAVFDNKQVQVKGHVVYNNGIVGASIKQSKFRSKVITSQSNDRLIPFYQRLIDFEYSKSRTVKVNSTAELLSAIAQAQPGDDIVITAGQYQINQRQVYLAQHGTSQQPIRLRADNFGEVTIALDTLEGFVIKGNYWIVENLQIMGVCAKDAKCEHAIHIVGAQHLIIRNNQLTNFNSTVKANARGKAGNRRYPDNILFEHNSVYNESSRQTSSSVTLIDVVTGSNWNVRNNFIANNSKHGSDYVSYALFLKGNGMNGLIEQNIIDCEWSLANDGHTRVGISLGGGGTGRKYCRGGSCAAEHTNGMIKNNLIANCSQDVGIYLNKSRDSQVIHNTLLNTFGVDVRFKESSAIISNNVTTGNIRTRDGGTMQLNENMTEFNQRFNEQLPTVMSEAKVDLCGFTRFKFSSIGAIGNECQKKLAFKTTSR